MLFERERKKKDNIVYQINSNATVLLDCPIRELTKK